MRRKSYLLSALLIIFIVLALAIACLPSLLSTSWGTKALISIYEKSTGNRLEIKELALSWSGPQRIQGVEFHEPYRNNLKNRDFDKEVPQDSCPERAAIAKRQDASEGKSFEGKPTQSKTDSSGCFGIKQGFSLTCKEIDSTSSFWKLLIQKDVGTVTLIDPEMSVNGQTKEKPAQTTEQKKQSSEKISKSAKQPFVLPFYGSVHIENGAVHILNQGFTVNFQDISAKMSAEKNLTSASFQISGKSTEEGLQGQFSLVGSFHQTQGFDLDCSLSHFPLRGVDRCLALFEPSFEGLIVAALGPSLDLNIQAKRAMQERISLNFNAASQNLQAKIETVSNDASLQLSAPGRVTFFFSPQLAQKISSLIAVPLSLKERAEISLSLEELFFPLTPEGIDFKKGRFKSLLTLRPSPFIINQAVLEVQNFSASLRSEMTGEKIEGLLSGLFKTPDSTQLTGSLTLKDIFSERAETSLSVSLQNLSTGFVDNLLLKGDKTLSLIAGSTLNLSLKDQISNQRQTISLQLESPLLKLVQANVEIKGLEKINLDVRSQEFSMSAQAALKDQTFTLSSPLKIKGSLSNAFLQDISASSEIPTLTEPFVFSLSAEPFSLDLKLPLLEQLNLKISGTAEKLALRSFDQKKRAELDAITFKLLLDAKKQLATVVFSSKVKDEGKEGLLDATLSLDHFNLTSPFNGSEAVCSLSIDLQQLSVSFVETWMGSRYPLSDLLGPTLDLHFKGLSSPMQQTMSLEAQSKYVSADIALGVENGVLKLQSASKPATFQLLLTKNGFALLNEILSNQGTNRPFELESPSSCRFSLSRLSWPIQKVEGSSLKDRLPFLESSIASLELEGTFSSDLISFKDTKTAQSAALRSIAAQFHKKSGDAPIIFDLTAIPFSASGKKSEDLKEGQIAISGRIDQLFDAKGAMNTEALRIDFTALIERMPTLMLDVLSRQGKGSFSGLFGPTLNAQIDLKLTEKKGPLKLNLNTANTRASLNGVINQGILTLSEPIYAQITLTPEVSAFLLKDANLFSLTKISSSNPLTLQIEPTGFSLPILPFDFKRFSVSEGKLELGQIYCKNEGNINLTLGLLKSRQLSQDKELMLWFAPLLFQLKEGVLNCQRTEILVAETYDIAIWGKIDLIKDYIDMVLGLTADCLSKAFGIKDLPPKYVMQLPIKGKSDKAEINKTKATAKIALLLAWQQKNLGGALKGSPGGALFGELAKRLGALPDFDSPAPPARHPYPWELEESEVKKKKSSDKGVKIKPTDKPFKQLLKIFH